MLETFKLCVILIASIILSAVLIKKTLKMKKQRGKINNIQKRIILLDFIGIILIILNYIYINSTVISKLLMGVITILSVIIPIVIIILEKILKVDYDEALIYMISKIQYRFLDKKRAKKIILDYLRKNPSYILQKQLAKIYQKEGGTRKAIEAYAKVIALDSSDYDSFLEIIKLMEYLDKKEETIQLSKKLLEVYKKSPKAYIIYADILESKGLLKEAAKIYEEGVKNNPQSKELIYNLASVYVRINEYVLAKTQFLKGYEIEKNNSVQLLNLGQILFIENELIEAEKYFKLVISLKKLADLAYYELAKIEILKNDENKGLEYLNKALEIDPKLISKVNESEIFKTIKSKTVVRVELVEKAKPQLLQKEIDTINKLEETLELMAMLKINENKEKAEEVVTNVIKEKIENTSVGELQEKHEKVNEFIEKHIEGQAELFNKYIYGEVKKIKEKTTKTGESDQK